ncbi:MAG: hypothetical protein QOG80_2914 [Pseudonocardiales bacterium]|jgi:hypothetical protein|nr:hypothetical protein [Pseudonocardiales bacterium]
MNEMNLDALNVELAYRRALLDAAGHGRYRARLPKRLLHRRAPRSTFARS